mmetsp:Transcript_61562/g.178549  ORF Transcript_61562/g.178549 Transcript_61562/m.178549 type:complete len:214 (-) Transcript_61562:127-768(-)
MAAPRRPLTATIRSPMSKSAPHVKTAESCEISLMYKQLPVSWLWNSKPRGLPFNCKFWSTSCGRLRTSARSTGCCMIFAIWPGCLSPFTSKMASPVQIRRSSRAQRLYLAATPPSSLTMEIQTPDFATSSKLKPHTSSAEVFVSQTSKIRETEACGDGGGAFDGGCPFDSDSGGSLGSGSDNAAVWVTHTTAACSSSHGSRLNTAWAWFGSAS